MQSIPVPDLSERGGGEGPRVGEHSADEIRVLEHAADILHLSFDVVCSVNAPYSKLCSLLERSASQNGSAANTPSNQLFQRAQSDLSPKHYSTVQIKVLEHAAEILGVTLRAIQSLSSLADSIYSNRRASSKTPHNQRPSPDSISQNGTSSLPRNPSAFSSLQGQTHNGTESLLRNGWGIPTPGSPPAPAPPNGIESYSIAQPEQPFDLPPFEVNQISVDPFGINQIGVDHFGSLTGPILNDSTYSSELVATEAIHRIFSLSSHAQDFTSIPPTNNISTYDAPSSMFESGYPALSATSLSTMPIQLMTQPVCYGVPDYHGAAPQTIHVTEEEAAVQAMSPRARGRTGSSRVGKKQSRFKSDFERKQAHRTRQISACVACRVQKVTVSNTLTSARFHV